MMTSRLCLAAVLLLAATVSASNQPPRGSLPPNENTLNLRRVFDPRLQQQQVPQQQQQSLPPPRPTSRVQQPGGTGGRSQVIDGPNSIPPVNSNTVSNPSLGNNPSLTTTRTSLQRFIDTPSIPPTIINPTGSIHRSNTPPRVDRVSTSQTVSVPNGNNTPPRVDRVSTRQTVSGPNSNNVPLSVTPLTGLDNTVLLPPSNPNVFPPTNGGTLRLSDSSGSSTGPVVITNGPGLDTFHPRGSSMVLGSSVSNTNRPRLRFPPTLADNEWHIPAFHHESFYAASAATKAAEDFIAKYFLLATASPEERQNLLRVLIRDYTTAHQALLVIEENGYDDIDPAAAVILRLRVAAIKLDVAWMKAKLEKPMPGFIYNAKENVKNIGTWLSNGFTQIKNSIVSAVSVFTPYIPTRVQLSQQEQEDIIRESQSVLQEHQRHHNEANVRASQLRQSSTL